MNLETAERLLREAEHLTSRLLWWPYVNDTIGRHRWLRLCDKAARRGTRRVQLWARLWEQADPENRLPRVSEGE